MTDNTVRLKRASYREAVAWIAMNDEAGADDSAEQCADYVTVQLIADIFQTTAERVGRDVFRYRAKWR
jgi:hypothetical protein